MCSAVMTTLARDMDPFVEPLGDDRFLIDLVSRVSHVPPQEVVERLKKEHYDLGVNVRDALSARGIKPFRWSDELETFYAESDAFLYESLVWNRTSLKNDMRRWIAAHLDGISDAPKRVLTFGDGLGFDAFYLAKVGHQVTYFDVSERCSSFAQSIFERGDLDIRMLADPADLSAKSFDVVICLDVLEHVPDPASLVKWLSEALREGGRMIVHAPFFFLHRCVSTHLKSNRKYSGDVRRLYRLCDLYPVDGQFFWNPIVFEKRSGGAKVRSQRPPFRVTAGKGLLTFGRFWSLPFNTITRMIATADKKQLVR